MLSIKIADREIFGHPRDLSRAEGLYVRPGGFQGWEGISNTRRESLARAVQHGEHDTPVYLGTRVVTIDGQALASTEYDLTHLEDSISGLLGVGRVEVTVGNRGRTLTARGRVTLAECDDMGHSGPLLRSDFQVQLTFADPRRYGLTQTLPGDRLFPPDPSATATAMDVFHHGNFPAFPVIVIPSAPSAYTITAGGRTFTVTAATAGGTHEVHLRNGRVYRNGVEMPGVGKGDLWAVPDNVSLRHFLSVPGRVKITDTFV